MFDKFIPNEIREAVDKVVPNELKGILGTAAATYAGGLMPGGMIGGGVGSFFTDLIMQSLLNDDDSGKKTDYLKAGMSSVLGGIKGYNKGTAGGFYGEGTKPNFVKPGTKGLMLDPSDPTNQTLMIDKGADPRFIEARPENLAQTFGIKDATGPSIAQSTFDAGYRVGEGGFKEGVSNMFNTGMEYAAPFTSFKGEDGYTLGSVSSGLTGAEIGNAPSQVRDARQALLDAENRYQLYLAEQKAKYGADFEEDRQTRIAAYKQYMGLAGYSEDEIDDALRVAGYIGDEETAYAANGGRIGFANGSDSYMGDVYGDRDRDSLDMKEFYKEYPETQVGTYINENRYKSEKIEKLETKLNEIIDMRQRTADRSRNPENDGMPSLMEKLLDKEIKALYADRTNDDLRKTRMQKLEEQEAARQQEAAMRAEQMKAAYQAEFGDGLNRTGRAMGGMMRPNYNMGGMMNAGMMNNNMMNPRMGYANGSIPDRPNFNYGSGRQTPQGDPIAPNMPPGMQMDLRPGGFIELGTEPRADDVPAMVGKDEFVLNDRAVAGIGKLITGQPDARAGAKALYDLQNKMEATV